MKRLVRNAALVVAALTVIVTLVRHNHPQTLHRHVYRHVYHLDPLNTSLLSPASLSHTACQGTEKTLSQIQNRLYKERLQYSQRNCDIMPTGYVVEAYIHADSELAYCPVPKVGCTFWKRIFLYLHNGTNLPAVDSPFQIPRQIVHYGKQEAGKVKEWTGAVEKLSKTFTKFLFARDPYSRLWSAYLDKFLLPDFWRSYAVPIIKSRVNASRKSQECHHDVNFEEFLTYVVSKNVSKANGHWKPIKYTCDPCIYKPDIIGKQETFADDARFILKDTNIAWVMDNFNLDTYVIEELSMLIDYNFNLVSYQSYVDCIDNGTIANLLWRVFQLNGYLPVNVEFATVLETLGNNITRENFKEYTMNMYTSGSVEEKRQWRLQKRLSLVSAFRKVPESLIKSLVEYYKDDFDMFGYDTRVPTI